MSSGRTFIGLSLVGLGVVYLLDAADAVDGGRLVARWWPLAVLVLAVVQMMGERRIRPGTVGLGLVGVILLGITTGAAGDLIRFVWPAVVIAAGVWILVGWGLKTSIEVGDHVSGLTVAGSDQFTSSSRSFKGGAVTAILGGADLDLRAATPVDGGARLAVTVAFGSVDVLVPDGWRVSIRGIPLFGGWDDTTGRHDIPADAPRLDIQALVLFGGLEVKHPRRWRA